MYLTPGLQVEMARNFYAAAMVQVPVHQRVNGTQLTSDHNYPFNVFYRFRGTARG